MTDTMEFVHDWIHNPLATKTGKLSALERAKNLFLGSLRTGELKQKLQEIKDNPDLIQKTRIVGHEASLKLNEVVTQNRLTHLKLMLERGYDPCAKLELPSGNTIPESQDNWSIAHEAVMANSCDTLLHLIEHGLELKKSTEQRRLDPDTCCRLQWEHRSSQDLPGPWMSSRSPGPLQKDSSLLGYDCWQVLRCAIVNLAQG